MTDLQILEEAAAKIYTATDTSERKNAEQTILNLVDDPQGLEKCQMMLERATTPYSQSCATTTLVKLVSHPSTTLEIQKRIDIKNYVLNYLFTRNLESFVVKNLIQLYAKITKLGWLDSYDGDWPFRNVVDDVEKFQKGKAGLDKCIIGVSLYELLIVEVDKAGYADNARPLTKQRKTAASFRDNTLLDCFKTAIRLLRTGLETNSFNVSDPKQVQLIDGLLRLAMACLNYDFIGTCQDESADDQTTVQIPTSWRQFFVEKDSAMQLFFDLYKILPAENCRLLLASMVQMASVRRSLFNAEERHQYLTTLMRGITSVLKNGNSLSNPEVYHEFCRLLGRLKANYQLGELTSLDDYSEAIRLIAEFTVQSLNCFQFSTNSLHYLLGLWQKLTASIPYIRNSKAHELDKYTPEVTKAYVQSRLECARLVICDGMDNPLDDQNSLTQQLDQISTICRCEYESTTTLLTNFFDQVGQEYSRVLNGQVSEQEKKIIEFQIGWLVFIIGAAVGGRISITSSDEHDALDGDLSIKILMLMDVINSGLESGKGRSEAIELAMLQFFDQFRKIYVGDQVHKSSKAYMRLSEVCSLNDESDILDVLVKKIIINLKYWSESEKILRKTLQLLSDLAVGYATVRKLIKLDSVKQLLHSHQDFPFLRIQDGFDNKSQVKRLKSRTSFYSALGRLLMVELGEDEETFSNFMRPVQEAFDILRNQLDDSNCGPNNTHSPQLKQLVIGVARDLNGAAIAFNNKTSYLMLFEWYFPANIQILGKALKIWYHDPDVTTPILKCMVELLQNRSQRLQFEVSSPNGVLLFREASNMLVTYGQAILGIGDIPDSLIYSHKLKGVCLCFKLLKSALSSNMVNFGIFKLYNDNALENAFETFVKLLVSITPSQLADYPKLNTSYYSLMEVITQDHMTLFAQLPEEVLYSIMQSITHGLAAWDTAVCTNCCTTLDHVVSFVWRIWNRRTKAAHSQNWELAAGQKLLGILEKHPELMQQPLINILNIIMFQDCKNQWSMSRPLLGLILINSDNFGKVQESLCSTQSPEKLQGLSQCFEHLMEGIDKNLHSKNRDRFTHGLSVFRREVNDVLKAVTSDNAGKVNGQMDSNMNGYSSYR